MDSNSGFDEVAPFYDRLVGMTFGKSMLNAQTFFLRQIDDNSNILVLGGGSGIWLNNFLEDHPHSRMTFIDSSQRMLTLAKNRVGEKQIEFRLGTQDSIKERDEFDVVITFCYLDLFEESQLRGVISKIVPSIKKNANWLVTDFVSTKRWHKIMLLIMYSFFRMVAGLNNKRLPDWNSALKHAGFEQNEVKYFYGNFIKSAVYKRSTG